MRANCYDTNSYYSNLNKLKFECSREINMKESIRFWGRHLSSLGKKGFVCFFCLILVCLLYRFMEKSARYNPDVLPPQL